MFLINTHRYVLFITQFLSFILYRCTHVNTSFDIIFTGYVPALGICRPEFHIERRVSKFVSLLYKFVISSVYRGVNELIGILVGHLYYFLKYRYPEEYGGRELIRTPEFL